MKAFWEKKFREVKTMWGTQPADTTVFARELFLRHKIKSVLLPGSGYGRNAAVFLKSGMEVTGIELSEYAINLGRKEFSLNYPVFQGSVTQMPFDNKIYDAVFCYALIHLLNKTERKQFIRNCYAQLKPGGFMVFVAISKQSSLYGNGRFLSRNRFELEKELKVYFYDPEAATKEFTNYGLFEAREVDEAIKFKENEPTMKFILILCQKPW